MDTIMAGLACGEPCKHRVECFEGLCRQLHFLPRLCGAQGMRVLGNPEAGDTKVVSGESRASAFGCIAEIMRDKTLVELKNKLKLDENSKVLFFSTEGDTQQGKL